MKKTIPKMLFMILCAAMLLSTVLPAYAAGDDTVDFTERGSVSVTLQTEGTPISGAELTVYRAADAVDADHNLSFAFAEGFAGFGGKPENLKTAEDAGRLADYVKEHKIAETASLKTDADGKAVFSDLPLGLYLVTQTGSAEGFSDCSPFLIAIPAQENNKWVYDTDATPKTDVVRLIDITVKKVWNDGAESKRPESVKVQLLKNGKTAETAELNEKNGWTYVWRELPKSDAYTVKEIDVPKGYTATYREKDFVFTVTNTSTLIQTGQLQWPIPVLAAAGLILIAGGLILRKRKNDRA